MPTTDNRTTNFDWPLPHAANDQNVDVARLIEALGAIDTAMFARPTSAAMDTAISAAVTSAVNGILDGAPGALNTLKELATAINNDASFASSVVTALAGKLGLGGGVMTGVITFHADQTFAAAKVTGLATVATSGAYGDLSGRPTLPSGAIVGTTDTQTLSGKRINPRAGTTNPNGSNPVTVTINADTMDYMDVLGITGAITMAVPSGTPVNRQKVLIVMKDAGVSKGITWTGGTGG